MPNGNKNAFVVLHFFFYFGSTVVCKKHYYNYVLNNKLCFSSDGFGFTFWSRVSSGMMRRARLRVYRRPNGVGRRDFPTEIMLPHTTVHHNVVKRK